ncbi:hypothetical protein FNZ23_20280, partial [Streptomyces benahoarensis]
MRREPRDEEADGNAAFRRTRQGARSVHHRLEWGTGGRTFAGGAGGRGGAGVPGRGGRGPGRARGVVEPDRRGA